MTNGTTKSLGQKNQLDKFYTKKEIVLFCLSKVELSSYDCIIEPSAGDGAFLLANPNFAYDLAPEHPQIEEQDWFTLDKSIFSEYSNILVIGNPPFGQQGSLARRFFNEAASFCHTIAFILPLSFRKESIQNQLNLSFSLTEEYVLPPNAFLLEGADYSVPCVFQVWRRTKVPRKKVKRKMTSKYIQFVSSSEADFRVQRVGGRAGQAFLELNGAPSSNYFLKNTSAFSTEELVSFINNLSFSSIEDTVGPKSLPKGELIETLEEYLESSTVDTLSGITNPG